MSCVEFCLRCDTFGQNRNGRKGSSKASGVVTAEIEF
jgi:hypothetical protein